MSIIIINFDKNFYMNTIIRLLKAFFKALSRKIFGRRKFSSVTTRISIVNYNRLSELLVREKSFITNIYRLEENTSICYNIDTNLRKAVT